METPSKIVLVVVIVAILAIGWIFFSNSKAINQTVTNNNVTTTSTIDEDIASVNSQLTNIDANQASIDKALNDTPIQQAQ